MTLPDANFWLSLVLSTHRHHSMASTWLKMQPATRQVLFCRSTQMALLRLLTTEAVMNGFGTLPLTNDEARGIYDRLLLDPRFSFADEPGSLEAHWKRFASNGMSSPKLLMDAYLAGFAIAGGHEMVTFDQAFRQFEGLNLTVLGV